MTWEETLARLEEAVRGGGDGAMVRKADIRAALERDEQGHAACVRHGCGCNDAGATRVECPEHAALRQRVEELEGRVESLTDRLSSTTEDYIRHRNALEAAERERDEWRDTAQSEMAGRRAAEANLERVVEATDRVLTEAGMQAHKHGCANRVMRPARWDEFQPCAGCAAEAALAAAKGE